MILMIIFLLEILLENTEDFSVNSVVSYLPNVGFPVFSGRQRFALRVHHG